MPPSHTLKHEGDQLDGKLAAVNRRSQRAIAAKKRFESDRDAAMRALIETQDAECGRISRELHDHIGQYVTALLLGLKSLEKDLGGGPHAKTTLQSLLAIAQSVGQEIHQVALELRPTSLEDLGLARSLGAFLDEWALRTKVGIDFDHATLGAARLPAHVETTLFRVVREALHNVFRHARATHVSVVLQRKARSVSVIIEDNGTGFDAAAFERIKQNPHLGLAGIKERVALINGELAIESGSGAGTTLIVRLPLSRQKTKESHG